MKYTVYILNFGNDNIEYSKKCNTIEEATKIIIHLNNYLNMVYSNGYRIAIHAELEDAI